MELGGQNEPRQIFLTRKMAINFKMFGAFMKNRVACDMESSLIVTVEKFVADG